MELTPEMREQVRLSILRYGQGPVTIKLLRSYLRGEGMSDITDCQVEREVLYLEDKGLLKKIVKEISPEVMQWRTSGSGMDYLAMQGQEG